MQSFEEYYKQQMIEEGKFRNALATGALAAGLAASSASASIFNNNPGNIRTSPTNWNGEVTEPGEEFERFSDMHMGVRASARILRTYGKKYGIDTINKIIDRYAPPEDNNPNNANYARHQFFNLKMVKKKLLRFLTLIFKKALRWPFSLLLTLR